jgi:hypothetical protein
MMKEDKQEQDILAMSNICRRFANKMTGVLSNNIKKGNHHSWRKMDVNQLLMFLKKEVLELEYELQLSMNKYGEQIKIYPLPNSVQIMDECCDVANFAMMIFDIIEVAKSNVPNIQTKDDLDTEK